MKNSLIILCMFFLILISCSKSDKSATGPYDNLSDQEVLDTGWQKFEDSDYNTALNYFDELLEREVLETEAYSGKGWSQLKLGDYATALENFNIAMVELPAGYLTGEVYSGLAVIYDYQGEFISCIDATTYIPSGWTFTHLINVTYDNMIVLRAASFYGLGDFANSLLSVQILVPEFSADINTVEGRALLAAKIEELRWN